MGNPENTIFNVVLKLTFPLCNIIVHKLCITWFIFTIKPNSKSCLL